MSNLTSTSSPEHDQQILAIGRQCSHTSCLLVDFLPFKCQHCANSFCADHFKPESHSCSKYDETKYNRVAPDCPLCNEPVPFLQAKTLIYGWSLFTKVFKTEVWESFIRSNSKCRQKFCPEHRFPNSHNCSSLSSPAAISNTPSTASTQLSAISASGLAAMRRAAASAKSAVPSPSTKTSKGPAKAASSANTGASGSKHNIPNPFSKTDRSPPPDDTKLTIDKSDTTIETPGRCSPKLQSVSAFDFNSRSKQERESQIRAMRARAQKGLLSEEEKSLLASIEAEGHRGSDKNCAIM
ncbi:hypothetical protein EI94DRAFT_1796354 [Lactarius quietus]|nr:hypothetical protein EI94DRAFT_1796354 [Lactarius quietus]